MAQISEMTRHPIIILSLLLALLPAGLGRGQQPATHPDQVIATLPGATPTPAETPTPGDAQVRAASSQTRAAAETAGIGWPFYAGLLLATFSIVLVLLARDRYRNGGLL